MVMQPKVRPRVELPTALVCTAVEGKLKWGLLTLNPGKWSPYSEGLYSLKGPTVLCRQEGNRRISPSITLDIYFYQQRRPFQSGMPVHC